MKPPAPQTRARFAAMLWMMHDGGMASKLVDGGKPDFLFLSQVTSDIVFDLSREVARSLGPTLVLTGNTAGAEQPGLTIWGAVPYDNRSYLTRLRTWLAFVAQVAAKMPRIRGRPVVLANTNPPFLPWLAYALKRWRGWPYVLRVLDIYPDALVQQGLVGTRHPVTRLWRGLNSRAFAAADHLVTLGPAMADRLRAQIPDGKAIEIIPDWVDADRIRPLAKSDNPFAREHGQVGKLTVLYAGNLGMTHDIRGLAGAAAALAQDPGIHFLFVWGGARRDELQELARRLPNVSLLPRQPAEMLPLVMACGDIGVVTLGSGAGGISMPSKAYYMMAGGCAILGLTQGDNDVARLVHRYDCGMAVDPSDSTAVRAAIERFRDDPTFLQRCRDNARRAAETDYSTRHCTALYLAMLRALRDEAGNHSGSGVAASMT